MALIDKITAIADGFRESRGTTDKLTFDEMAVLAAEPIGGGGDSGIPEEAFNITGNCTYRFANGGWDWFIENYGNSVTTADISNTSFMFSDSKVEEIPFVINITNVLTSNNMFKDTTHLTKCPKIRGTIRWGVSTTLESLVNNAEIADLEDLFDPEMLDGFKTVKVTSAYSVPRLCNFTNCSALLSIPSWWYKFQLCEESTAFPSSTYCLVYFSSFSGCWRLTKATNIPVWRCQGAQTSNMFSNAVTGTYMLDTYTFDTADGQPITTQWKSQTIDFSNVGVKSNGVGGAFTSATRVHDAISYQALKNDPDWWASDLAYSRYNHDSAVETINSLPDTSAYLASAGGTNTIKFKGSSGSATDGGAINTLTAEEIAVAAAKGWTVTLA